MSGRASRALPAYQAYAQHGSTVFLVPVQDHWLFYAPLRGTAALVGPRAAELLRQGRAAELGGEDCAAFEAALADTAVAVGAREGPLVPTMLGIIPTRGCNMACSYCDFEGPSAARRFMRPRVAEAAVDWAAARTADAGQATLNLQFFGGEPFIAPEVVKTVVRRAQQVCRDRHIAPHFDASTNGYFGAEMQRFIAEHFHSIVLSLDGPAAIQDRQRAAGGGRASSARVERTARWLGESPVALCLRMCVTRDSVPQMEDIVRWMIASFHPAAIDFETLTPGPLAERAGLAPPDPYVFAHQAQRCRRIAEDAGVTAVYAAAEATPARTTFCPAGSDAVIVSPDGRIGGCYLQPQEWAARGMDLHFGFIGDEGQVTIDAAALHSVRRMPAVKPRCANCFCRFGCAGGCHVNQTFPGCPTAYTDFCLQTRVLTACRLLGELGQAAGADALVADGVAMRRLAVHRDDGLRRPWQSAARPAADCVEH